MAHLTGFEPVAYRLGGGRSILLSYRCLPLPLHYSRRARGLSRKRTGMRTRREKAGARENECGTGVKMRRTGKRRCRAAAIPCCGEKRTLFRTGAGQKALLFEVPRQRLMFRTGTGQSRAGSRSAACEKTLRARERNHFPLLRRLRRAKNAPRTGAESYCAHAVTVRGRNRSAHGEQDRAEAAFRSVSGGGTERRPRRGAYWGGGRRAERPVKSARRGSKARAAQPVNRNARPNPDVHPNQSPVRTGMAVT